MDDVVVELESSDGLVERGRKISCVLDVGSRVLETETRSRTVDNIHNLENRARSQGLRPRSWSRKKMALQLKTCLTLDIARDVASPVYVKIAAVLRRAKTKMRKLLWKNSNPDDSQSGSSLDRLPWNMKPAQMSVHYNTFLPLILACFANALFLISLCIHLL